MDKKYLQQLLSILAVIIISGCGNAALTKNTPVVLELAEISPGSDLITSSTAENIVLLDTFSGHSKIVLDVEFTAGEISLLRAAGI